MMHRMSASMKSDTIFGATMLSDLKYALHGKVKSFVHWTKLQVSKKPPDIPEVFQIPDKLRKRNRNDFLNAVIDTGASISCIGKTQGNAYSDLM